MKGVEGKRVGIWLQAFKGNPTAELIYAEHVNLCI